MVSSAQLWPLLLGHVLALRSLCVLHVDSEQIVTVAVAFPATVAMFCPPERIEDPEVGRIGVGGAHDVTSLTVQDEACASKRLGSRGGWILRPDRAYSNDML